MGKVGHDRGITCPCASLISGPFHSIAFGKQRVQQLFKRLEEMISATDWTRQYTLNFDDCTLYAQST